MFADNRLDMALIVSFLNSAVVLVDEAEGVVTVTVVVVEEDEM